MKSDVIFDKLNDLFIFLVCVVIILGIARISGILKGFAPGDFQDAYYEILNYIPGINENLSASSKTNKNSTRYNGYLPSRIPDGVISSSIENRMYSNILTSETKGIFYVYDTHGSKSYSKDFNDKLQNYIARSPYKTYYNVYSYTYYVFKNLRYGVTGPSEICNSIEDCKAQKDHATNYAALQALFEKCAKTMCIFNPAKKQYVMLRTRDYDKAVKMIQDLRNW